MKVITTLLIIFIIWYIAGIFRQTYLMALAVCIAIMVIVLLILSIIQKKKLSVSLHRNRMIVFKDTETPIAIAADNKGRFPVNRYRVTLELKYPTDKKCIKKKLFGCASGSKENKDNISEFYLNAPCCGVIDIEFRKLRVYDPMSVLYSDKKLREKGQILVFPPERHMNIITPLYGSFDDLPLTDTVNMNIGDDHSEIRQIREYRPGDLTRHIHRNYSARTDSVWVKEFSKENDHIIDVFLNASTPEANETEWLDAFYELVCAAVSSMLKKDVVLNIHWYDKEKKLLAAFEVKSADDIPEMLARLYIADKACTEEEFSSLLPSDPTGTMVINTRLEWFFSGRPVYRFSRDNIIREISSHAFRP